VRRIFALRFIKILSLLENLNEMIESLALIFRHPGTR
jgi:hypothetical protein